MYFNPNYKQIKILLNSFLDHKIVDYNKTRNFSYFDGNSLKNVSGLSPFISRGLLKEEYLLKKIINSKKTSDKFIQEIFWRIYWQGWLESHATVWKKFKEDIKEIERNSAYEMETYTLATSGETKIKPFDEWVKILKKNGYLHNHARMWFASIWIFYLGIPWQLGAKFFYENLLDGDVASNLLSWRWVAGIQTKGKKYIATEENINKYTFNRYTGFKLPKIKNINLDYEVDKTSIIKYAKSQNSYKNSMLIITENNLNTDLLDVLRTNFKILVLIKFNIKSVKRSKVVLEFYEKLFTEFIRENSIEKIKYYEVVLPNQAGRFNDIIKKYSIKSIVYQYLRNGYEKDIMFACLSKLCQDVKAYNILDAFYINSWQYCEKGFFKFKNKIPLLLKRLS